MRTINNYVLVGKDGMVRFGSYFLHFVYKKIMVDHEDFILVVVGRKGRGKSYASIRTAEKWSNGLGVDFNIRDNVKHTVKSTLVAINSGNLEVGSPIIIEEMGVLANSRDFMSTVNKVLSFLAQTVRVKHYFIIINVPKWKMIDKSVRVLANARLEILRKNISNKTTTGKLYLLEYEDTQKEKEWRRFLRFKVMNVRKLYVLKNIIFHLPSEELCTAYEEKKIDYTNKLYSDLENSLEPEMGEIDAVGTGLGSSQASALRLFNEEHLSLRQIARVFGVRQKSVSNWISGARKHGEKITHGKKLSDGEFMQKGVLYYRDLVKTYDGGGGV